MATRRPPARRTTRSRRPSRKPSDQAGLTVFWVAAICFVGLVVLSALPFLAIPVFGIAGFFGYKRIRDGRRQKALWAIRAQHVGSYLQMSPKEFERALAFLCERDGCTNVRVVGGAGDLGADVIATTPDGRRIVIQAKRYAPTNKVGSPDIQKVGGTFRVVHQAHLAAVVTTSDFTRAAVDYARQAGIRTVGANALAGWASRTGPAPWH